MEYDMLYINALILLYSYFKVVFVDCSNQALIVYGMCLV